MFVNARNWFNNLNFLTVDFSGKMIDKYKKLDSKVEVLNLNLVTFGFEGKMTEKHVKTL